MASIAVLFAAAKPDAAWLYPKVDAVAAGQPANSPIFADADKNSRREIILPSLDYDNPPVSAVSIYRKAEYLG